MAPQKSVPYSIDGDEILIKQRLGCIFLLGVPLFIFGLLVLFANISRFVTEGPDEFVWWKVLIGVLIGLVLTGAGGRLLLVRQGTTIDRAGKQVRAWKKFLRWQKSKKDDLSIYESVVLRKEGRDTDSPDLYHVELKGAYKTLSIFGSPFYNQARGAAVELARFLDFPLHSVSSGKVETISSDRLSDNLRERYKAEKTGIPRRQPPEGCRATVSQGHDFTSIEINEPGLKKSKIIQAAVPVGIFIYLSRDLGPWLINTNTPAGVRMAIWGALILFLVCLPVLGLAKGFLRSNFGKTRITSDGRTLKVTEKSFLSSRETEIPLDEILEIYIPAENDSDMPEEKAPSQGIRIFSRSRAITVGGSLSLAEAKYVHATLLGMVVS